MTLWRQLPFCVASAAHHLAAADALLAGVGLHQRPSLRWYAAAQPALVLGTSQRPQEADLSACQQAGVTLHRRSSGGTAVLMSPDFVMLDVALPAGHRLALPDITEAYRWLGEVWVAVLRSAGLPARIISVAEARADRQALDGVIRQACFGGRSPYEVLVEDRKVVGLSQVRRRSGTLLQVGLYRTWSPERLASLLALSDAERVQFVERLMARVAGLDDLLPIVPDLATIQAAFAQVVYSLHNVTFEAVEWSVAEQSVYEQRMARYAPLNE